MEFFRAGRLGLTPAGSRMLFGKVLNYLKGWRYPASNLGSEEEPPLRGELLSLDLLRQQARSLAENHRTEERAGPNLLLPRLVVTERILRDYNEKTLLVEKTRSVTPAAEWLLDNFHLIEEQIRTAQRHLPRRFHQEL